MVKPAVAYTGTLCGTDPVGIAATQNIDDIFALRADCILYMQQGCNMDDICRLLAVRHGITVLTKSDLVDQESLQVLTMAVQEFLHGSFLERSPIIAVSAISGAGLEQLKQELVCEANKVTARDSTAITRLPIDRVFTIKGFGTVVTGTLIAGTIRKEDELQLFPSGKRVRVRGVQVHGQKADTAVAGERTALNLTGIEKDELARGMMLALPGTLERTRQIDGVKHQNDGEWILVLPDADRPLFNVYAEAKDDDRALMLVHEYADKLERMRAP